MLLAIACENGASTRVLAPTTPLPRITEPTQTAESGQVGEVQRDIVEAFIRRSTMVRVACLDQNADGRIDDADARGDLLVDINGDAIVDEADLEVIRLIDFVLPEGKPAGCAQAHPNPDWQVSSPVPTDCDGRKGGLLLLAVGGGSVELSDPNNAAGVRWMLVKIAEELHGVGIPNQLASVNPGLVGTEHTQVDAEAWALAYIRTQLLTEPCLWIVLLGHSHGGAAVTATAAHLEEAGFGDRILLTVVIDRVTRLYAGDSQALPQTSPVFNLYQTNDDVYEVRPIDQPNIENWDASGLMAPEAGQEGGELMPVNHSTLDNSQAALDRISQRILEEACEMGLC